APAPRLDDVVAVGVEHGHHPDVMVVYQPGGIGVRAIPAEQPVSVARGNFHDGDLASVDTRVVPEDRLGACDVTVGDVQHPQVVPVKGRGLGAGSRVRFAPGIAYIYLLGQVGVSCYLLVQEGLHLLHGLVAAVEIVEQVGVV